MRIRHVTRHSLALAGVITASCLIGAISVQPSAADSQPGDIYVAAGFSGCSDSGPGTSDIPFCTIGAAAAVAGPGQTVHVESGTYNETVHLTRSGNPGAPITFVADRVNGNEVDVGNFNGKVTGDAFDISGAQHVVIRGFGARPGAGSAFRVDGGAQDVTIDQAYAEGSPQQPAILVTGGSTDVVVSRAAVTGSNASIRFDSGSTGTIASNTVDSMGKAAAPTVDLVDAPGTAVVGNTLLGNCQGGISVTGGSTGTTIENNIVVTAGTRMAIGLPMATTACATPAQVPAAISVAGDSTAQSHLDYNLLDTPGGTPYAWAGTPFASAADLTPRPARAPTSSPVTRSSLRTAWVPTSG